MRGYREFTLIRARQTRKLRLRDTEFLTNLIQRIGELFTNRLGLLLVESCRPNWVGPDRSHENVVNADATRGPRKGR